MVSAAGAAVIAIATALLYLSDEPGPIPPGAILTTVLGIGITVMIAAVLAALMFRSSRSGRDDAGGGP